MSRGLGLGLGLRLGLELGLARHLPLLAVPPRDARAELEVVRALTRLQGGLHRGAPGWGWGSGEGRGKGKGKGKARE